MATAVKNSSVAVNRSAVNMNPQQWTARHRNSSHQIRNSGQHDSTSPVNMSDSNDAHIHCTSFVLSSVQAAGGDYALCTGLQQSTILSAAVSRYVDNMN
jgi:hypothetical protein